MKISVQFDVPFVKGLERTCETGNGGFWDREICGFISYRDRQHGNKYPAEKHIPKCRLFNQWLDREDGRLQKCKACIKHCLAAKGEDDHEKSE